MHIPPTTPFRSGLKSRTVVTSGAELLGSVFIGVGLWQMWAPLAWLWAGLVLFAVSFLLEIGVSPRADAGAEAADRTALADDAGGDARESE